MPGPPVPEGLWKRLRKSPEGLPSSGFMSSQAFVLAAARVALAQAKTGEVEREIEYVAVLEVQAAENNINKINSLDTRQAGRLETIEMAREDKDLALEHRLDLVTQEETFANTDKTTQAAIDLIKVDGKYAEAGNKRAVIQAHTRAVELLAKAKIETTLTHFVKKNT